MKWRYIESRGIGISYRKWNEGTVTGLATAGVGTAF